MEKDADGIECGIGMGMNRNDTFATLKAMMNGRMPFVPFLRFQLAPELWEQGTPARLLPIYRSYSRTHTSRNPYKPRNP